MEMIDDLLHEEHVKALPEWNGVPLGRLVTDYHHPDELDAGWRRWIEINGHFNSIFLSKMWRRSYTVPHAVIGAHTLDQFDVDLRCAAGAHDAERDRLGLGLGRICQCVGESTTQIICAVCSWHHIGTEHDAVEAWHDHAFPGWRDLPIIPAKLRGTMGATKMTPKLEEWLEENYPAAFRIPGAPSARTAAPAMSPTTARTADTTCPYSVARASDGSAHPARARAGTHGRDEGRKATDLSVRAVRSARGSNQPRLREARQLPRLRTRHLVSGTGCDDTNRLYVTQAVGQRDIKCHDTPTREAGLQASMTAKAVPGDLRPRGPVC